MNDDALPALPVDPVAGSKLAQGVRDPGPDMGGDAPPLQQDTFAAGMFDSHYSFFDLFLDADPVVKAVVIILLAASVWSWTIIFEKTYRLWRLMAKMTLFEQMFQNSVSVKEFFDRFSSADTDHPMGMMVLSLVRDMGKNKDDPAERSARRRESVLTSVLTKEMIHLRRRLDFLASVGSSAPFIGLFGTVWGIMNSFQAIGFSKNTSLAVVAPGIAEALFATALGLVAAIPAVLAYNRISNILRRMEAQLVTFGEELLNFVPYR